MAISLQVAQGIGALFIGSLFYGLYLPTLFFCLRCLLWHTSRSNVHWLILLAGLTLFISSTLNLGVGMLRSVRAFLQCTDPAGVHAFDNVSDWVNVTRTVTTFVNIFVGDGILIYRCWIVWCRNYYIIILSLILYFGNLSCAAVIVWREVNIQAPSLVNVDLMKPFFLANTALTIPLNVITTVLIVFRIWRVDSESTKYRRFQRQESRKPKPTTLHSIIRIIVESGLLYTATAVISFCTYVTNSNAFYIATSLETQIIGIAFNLIVIRAHNRSADEYTLPPTTMTVTGRSIQFTQPTVTVEEEMEDDSESRHTSIMLTPATVKEAEGSESYPHG